MFIFKHGLDLGLAEVMRTFLHPGSWSFAEELSPLAGAFPWTASSIMGSSMGGVDVVTGGYVAWLPANRLMASWMATSSDNK